MATNVAPNDPVDGRDASKGDEILLNDSTSGKLGRASKDDPATMAASEGIRHASISDHAESVAGENRAVAASTNTTTTTSVVDAGPGSKSAEHTREATPQTTDDTRLVEKVASPGKKRGRDQEDEDESAGEEPSAPRQCSSSPEGHTSKSGRNGREKKRHRDASIEPTKDRDEEQVIEEKSTVTPSTKSDAEEKQVTKETPVTSEPPPENPSDTFKKSAFGALAASTTSPFGTIGADKPSVFGGGASKQASVFSAGSAAQTSSFGGAKASGSGFGAFSGDKPLNGFGSTFGSSGPSAFGGAGSGTFGSVLATGFGSAGGTKLSSFAAPDKSSTSHETKPAKAFGAPESDAEDSEDDEKDSGADPEVNPEEEGEGKTPSEDKKLKFAKVPIENGEAEECTILQVRAKLFALPSTEKGWQERGMGSLKINVHRSSIKTYPNGEVVPKSFDPNRSGVGEAAPARLVMRQENTHRLILNTIIYKSLAFQKKPSNTSVQLMFMAMEAQEGSREAKPIQMLLKMNEASAVLFREEIDHIQNGLAS